MTIIQLYKHYLEEQRPSPSPVTIKNYVSDIQKFLTWFETEFEKEFSQDFATPEVLSLYKKALQELKVGPGGQTAPAATSIERYFSSLRKFFTFLLSEGLIQQNPFETYQKEASIDQDPWQLKAFKDYLYTTYAAKLTTKNYLLDIRQFLSWAEQVTSGGEGYVMNYNDVFSKLSPELIEEYKRRLLQEAHLSPVSINRKLSSLRKYTNWAFQQGLLKKPTTIAGVAETSVPDTSPLEVMVKHQLEENTPVESKKEAVANATNELSSPKTYSSFGPLRLFQRLGRGGSILFEWVIITPIAKGVEQALYLKWKLTGEQLFTGTSTVAVTTGITGKLLQTVFNKGKQPEQNIQAIAMIDQLITQQRLHTNKNNYTELHNIARSVYAPHAISTKAFAWHKKALHHLRHTRPQWYHTYHAYPVVHYLHFGVLVLATTAMGILLYRDLFPSSEIAFAAATTSSSRILSYQGHLTDSAGKPITSDASVQFAVYNDPLASGSAKLWEETKTVHPDNTGFFSVGLGQKAPLPTTIFTDNQHVFLGVTVGNDTELSPRQQISTVGSSESSDTLQGLAPITDPSAGTRNAVLALDSAGNLTIGGTADPIFQVTNGQFTLSGQPLLLTTNPGSNGNITLSPDGLGAVDVQRPLVNTTTGTVDVANMFSVTATGSGQPVVSITQQGSGPLISASASGSNKFLVDEFGAGSFAGNVTIDGGGIKTHATSFSIAAENAINVSLGVNATAISIGAAGGQTTINNSLVVSHAAQFNGGVTVGDGQTLTLKGSVASSLVPTDSSTLDLGSSSKYWNNAYITNLYVSPSATVNGFWQKQNNILSPTSSNNDFVLGGTSLGTAKFSVLTNLFSPTASLSGATGSTYLSANGALQTTQNQQITIGGATSGNIALLPQNGTGNVGIGTSTPAFQLQLSQDSAAKPNGGQWTNPSDRRIKKDISDFTDGLTVLEQIHPVNYTYNGLGGSPADLKSIGVIAQEMAQVAPYTVSTYKAKLNPTDTQLTDLYNFNASALTFVTINAVKELDAKLVTLSQSVTPVTLSPLGELQINGSTGEVKKADGTALTNTASFAQAVIGSLQTGLSQTGKLTVSGASILNTVEARLIQTKNIIADTISVQGMSLKDYVLSLIQNSPQLIAPIADADILTTKAIAAGKSAHLAVDFSDDKLTIKNGTDASSSAVAEFDSQGNASLSGSLTVGKDATVSGTLSVGTLKADNVDLSASAISKLGELMRSYTASSAATPTPESAIHNSTPTPTLIPTIAVSPTPAIAVEPNASSSANASNSASTSALSSGPITSDYLDTASVSAMMSATPSFKTDFATVTQGLISYGSTSLADTAVAGQLSVGGAMILSDTSINVLGNDLSLQPLRQGGISLEGGLLSLDTEGNLSLNGNAVFAKEVTVKGKLGVNVISPLANADLSVQLGSPDASSANTTSSKFLIKNASNSGVLQVNQGGDVIASGSGMFSEILARSLHLIRGAQADTSSTETVASSSAGVGSISAGQLERTIISPFITEKTLIYITPTSDTEGMTPYVARQTAENAGQATKGSFTVHIPYVLMEPLTFNWWIVN